MAHGSKLTATGTCAGQIAGALLALGVLAGWTLADEQPGKLEVHDMSFWIVDPGAAMANARTAFPSALPVTALSLRSGVSSRASRGAAPVNLLTFHGPPAANLDVDLKTDDGSFLTHWPPGESLPNRLRWSGMPAYELVESLAEESALVFVDGESWMKKAREGHALYVKRGARAERFLAYDVELKLAVPLSLTGGPDEYRVSNTSSRPVYDVLIARRTPEGIRVGWLDVVPPGKQAEKDPNAQSSNVRKGDKLELDLLTRGDLAGGAIAEGAFEARAAQKAAAEAGKLAAAEAKVAAAITAAQQRLAAMQTAQKAAAQPPADDRLAPANALPDRKQAAQKKENEAARAMQLLAMQQEMTALKAMANRLAQQRLRIRQLAIQRAPGRALNVDVVAQPVVLDTGEVALAAPAAGEGNNPATKLFGGLPAAKGAPGVKVTLSDPLEADEAAKATTEALAERLVEAGLTAHEARQMVDHYGPLLFDSEALVVACRLDPAVINEKLPLSVFPAPAKTVRVALLLQRNSDPQLGEEVEKLVAQLGDRGFAVREAAQQRLIELGPLAFPALNAALNNPDLEIVIRAERILLNQQQTPNARAGVGGAPAGVIRAAPVIINR